MHALLIFAIRYLESRSDILAMDRTPLVHKTKRLQLPFAFGVYVAHDVATRWSGSSLRHVDSTFGVINNFIIDATKLSFNRPMKHSMMKEVIRANGWLAIDFGMYRCPWLDTGQELMIWLDDKNFDTGQGTNSSILHDRKSHFLILEYLLAFCLEALQLLDDDFEVLQNSSTNVLELDVEFASKLLRVYLDIYSYLGEQV